MSQEASTSSEVQRERSKGTEAFFCTSFLLAVLAVPISSCSKAPPDQKESLIQSLKGENVEGYNFETKEDPSEEIAALTNGAVRDLIKLDSDRASVVLRYTRVVDKKANRTSTYKTEINKDGASLTLRATDMATKEVVLNKTFPVPESTSMAGGEGPNFDTISDCLKEFECTSGGALQCEANRTCEDQYAALDCCLTNGQCFSVHVIVRPTTWRCKLSEVTPDIEGVVFSR